MKDNDFDLPNDDKNINDFSDYDNNYERKPVNDGYDTFSLRTDPSKLLKDLELQLRNKYIKTHKDGKRTEEQIPNTEPLCNEQGIQEILRSVKSVVNNHSVQGNQTNIEHHRLRMRELADSLTIFFWTHYENWNLETHHVNSIIDNIYFLMDLFLTRTLENKERELYGETYKESTSREVKNDKTRGGFLGNAIKNLVSR